jgi:predicted enzyme related to lactoylglutathione lyase
MTARFDLVTIDSPRTERLAAFWAAALHLVEVEREDGDRWIVLAERDGPRRLGIQRGNHWPGGVHLDLACDPAEFDAEVARVVALGATLERPVRREPYGSIANLADPDGNLFDVVAYTV